jgi:homogentisate 1,2-dioxygenase
MTASAFVAPRGSNKNAWLYRARPAVAHEGFVGSSFLRQGQDMLTVT